PPLLIGEPKNVGVGLVQQALKDLGYGRFFKKTFASGKPDGVYGRETSAAVLQFQTDQGFPKKGQDGKAGKDTLARLDQEIQKRDGGGPPPPPPPPPPGPPPVPVAVTDVVKAITDLAKKVPAPILNAAGVVLPTTLRFLDADEQSEAMTVYG